MDENENLPPVEPIVIVASEPDQPAVEPLLEHVEQDEPKWIDNAVEHERFMNRLRALEEELPGLMHRGDLQELLDGRLQEVAEVAREAAQSEIENAAAIAEATNAEEASEVVVDVEPVNEPAAIDLSSERHRSAWDVFGDED